MVFFFAQRNGNVSTKTKRRNFPEKIEIQRNYLKQRKREDAEPTQLGEGEDGDSHIESKKKWIRQSAKRRSENKEVIPIKARERESDTDKEEDPTVEDEGKVNHAVEIISP